MKKVVVIGTVGLPACYGGFESLVENLTNNNSDSTDYIVFCSSKNYVEKKTTHNGARLVYLPLNANGVQSIPYDILSLIKCWWIKPDTVLILGVSGCLFLPVFRFLSKSKIVTNIDGLEWRRDKWSKWAKKFLKWSEAIAVKYSDIVVTDNKAISDYVKEEYATDSITIAYGGDHVIRNINAPLPKEEYALGLCRIEPENNVSMILGAYKVLNKKLKFVGNWSASEYGRKLREQYQGCESIELIDPIYDLDELYKLRKGCSIYLHGHSAGGTNPSLVEMMHFQVPILAFDCSFNRYSTENKANYFKNSEELAELILSLNSDECEENSKAMRDIAKRKYTWDYISKSYEDTY